MTAVAFCTVTDDLRAELDHEGPDLPEVDHLNAGQTAATLAWAQTQRNRFNSRRRTPSPSPSSRGV